jgi:hypothetical protein
MGEVGWHVKVSLACPITIGTSRLLDSYARMQGTNSLFTVG